MNDNRPGIALVMVGILFCGPAAALGAEPDWRPLYDLVMMWVNFVILVAILVKFLHRPLRAFLEERRDIVRETLERLESDKRGIEAEIDALQQSLEERRRRAEALHQRIVDRGRSERRELVAGARQEAHRRLAKARQQIEARQREAWQTLRNDIVDAAVDRAMTELPRHVTPESQKALVDLFLKSISKAPR